MRLLYINPNSTATMTEAVVEAARAAAPGHEILGWTNADGPPAIQGPEDGAAAVAGILRLLPEARAAGAEAIVLACFDDTGLAEVRAAASCPVLGIGQAAFHLAALLGHRFSVVTTLPVSVPVIEENLRGYGLMGQCGRVRASGLAVLEVEAAAPPTLARLAAEIAAAEAEDGVTAAVLGCAGMAPLVRPLAAHTGLRLIDGVAAAAHLAPAVVSAARG
ncbi:HyuE hydantoin racemase [Rhodobacter sphaeroides]|uniref:HyuE hydantoin racemase n=1 Tax=Cereibacter sphaeroides (strain ATCC 17023 / DSM 158 / JCM 6121 / CCUG 31486 / LMG 2827 / NBRC 12203 / NCIMB 8253 / ATH 2.4.1.) TaxID=272943 RepID=Q3IWZ6_CERS4|nr:aspartate/glutamate racemase family protein [Cereibacter sphaeroides]ABA80938.2 HyuE hydantoin racemase [Cereibacter sphaeroides 2.4.1]AMJ49264.1 HyuE hydantoin racemase [Cereibacter sphaeroides]ANS35971.1 HyuE hydantoin racemase [Cereibacter sphaeroides]ATN65035.1 HyuE hydantoin racemase [Cereibacter sphaeroides]AXC63234.1 HyuE hydantoin racemase [Cereibacter sphaeroides 2.4.1]